MKLLRYVKLDNGKIIDLKNGFASGYKGKSYSYLGDTVSYEQQCEFLHCGGGLFKGKVLATASTIWELTCGNWFTLTEHKLPLELSALFNLKNIDDFSSELDINEVDMKFFNDYYDCLFAPISVNGEIVRYERVWKRDEKE